MKLSGQDIKLDNRLPGQAILDGLNRWHPALFFLVIFCYQLLVRFQGLDFNDEGFHIAFYQQVFSDPQSVQFGFWMWFTGIIGALVLKLTPFLGLWGIRLAGALVVTATIWVAYRLLRPFIQPAILYLGFFLLLLFEQGDAKNLYYNNLSALIYFLTAALLYRGIRRDQFWPLLGAGFLIGLNIFARLPNLLGIAIISAVFFYGWLERRPIGRQFRQAVIILLGFVAAIGASIASMKALGHLSYFIASVKMIFLSAHDAGKNDGLGGAYGIVRLLTRNLSEYASALKAFLLIAATVGFSGFLGYLTRQSPRWIRLLVIAFNVLLMAGFAFLALRGWFHHYRLLMFFTGISLLSFFELINTNRSREYRLLVFLGGAIAFLHPFGSSEGITTVEMYSLWIAFLVALHLLSRIAGASLLASISDQGKTYTMEGRLLSRHLRLSAFAVASIISLALFYNLIKYPYLCDQHSRSEMWYSVDNPKMHGIFTSKARATAINELLQASARYVKKGDIVLAYDCMPLYHFMTETRSYVRNPCIWFYTTELFDKEMKAARERDSALPVVIRQEIMTTGEGDGWPEKLPAQDYSLLPRNQAKNKIMDAFLTDNKYRKVWSNKLFSIYLPGDAASAIPKP